MDAVTLSGSRRLLAAGGISLAALIALAGASPAAAGGWTPVGGPVVRPEVALHLVPPAPGEDAQLYARVLDAGGGYLWRSPDAGATWRDLEPGLGLPVQMLGLDPAHPEILWAWTVDRGLWRSADAGTTWSQRYPASGASGLDSFDQLLVDPQDSETLYSVESDFSSGEIVAVSHDGGVTFQATQPYSLYRQSPDPIRVQPARRELLAFVYEGLEASRDGGLTWQLRGRFAQAGFHGGDLAPAAPDTLYGLPSDKRRDCLARSDDDGAHWRRLTYPPHLPAAHGACYDVRVDPRDARHVWVAAEIVEGSRYRDLLFASRDGGETWSRGLPLPARQVLAAGGEELYASGNADGLFVSEDGGRTWTPKDRGIIAGDLRAGLVAQRSPSGGGRRLVARNASVVGTPGSGVYRSDGGKDWTLTPVSPIFIAGVGGSTVLANDHRGLMRSVDGGTSWSLVPTAPPDLLRLRPNLAQPQYLVLLQDEVSETPRRVVWASDDAGATWHHASRGLPIDCPDIVSVNQCPEFDAYAVDPFAPSRRWLSYSFDLGPPVLKIFRSLDGGATWQTQTTALPAVHVLAADPLVPNRLLAATDGGLFASVDGGDHWLPLGDLPDGAVIHQFVRDGSSGAWYAATVAHGIFRSLDGGAHWSLLAGAPDHDRPAIAIDPRKPTALLAAFAGQGVWRWTP